MEWKDVQYIGMSTRALKTRWDQLERALDCRRGHAAGDHISAATVCKRSKDGWTVDGADLLVSAMVIPVDEALADADKIRKHGQVAYLEYEALAQYCAQMKRVPTYNFSTKLKKWNGAPSTVAV